MSANRMQVYSGNPGRNGSAYDSQWRSLLPVHFACHRDRLGECTQPKIWNGAVAGLVVCTYNVISEIGRKSIDKYLWTKHDERSATMYILDMRTTQQKLRVLNIMLDTWRIFYTDCEHNRHVCFCKLFTWSRWLPTFKLISKCISIYFFIYNISNYFQIIFQMIFQITLIYGLNCIFHFIFGIFSNYVLAYFSNFINIMLDTWRISEAIANNINMCVFANCLRDQDDFQLSN